jgi:hypothetical protein
MEKRKVKCPACGQVQEVLMAADQTAYRCKAEKCQKLVRAVACADEAPVEAKEAEKQEAPKQEEKKSNKKKK